MNCPLPIERRSFGLADRAAIFRACRSSGDLSGLPMTGDLSGLPMTGDLSGLPPVDDLW
jgi:hypothetical protein